jgi:hypothetical protein
MLIESFIVDFALNNHQCFYNCRNGKKFVSGITSGHCYYIHGVTSKIAGNHVFIMQVLQK